jgi:hypothetical protein
MKICPGSLPGKSVTEEEAEVGQKALGAGGWNGQYHTCVINRFD